MKRNHKAVAVILLIFLLAAGAEMLLANFAFISYGGNAEITDYHSDSEYKTVLDEDTQLLANGLGFDVNSVSFKTRAVDEYFEPYFATVKLYANTEDSNVYSLVLSKKIVVGKEETLRFGVAAPINGILITFDDFDDAFEAGDLTVNPEYSLQFNSVRFLLIFLAAELVFLLKHSGTGKRLREKLGENGAKTIAVAVCVAVCGVFSVLGATCESVPVIDYPLNGRTEYYSPYVQQFDAFQKGQLNIDVEPDERLLELENPYDPNQREDIDYLWDRAFYNGKYYSYFGVTPIFTVYYPFWLITGSLPNDTTVKAVFAVLAAVFLPLAVFELSRLTGKKQSPQFVCVAAVGAFFTSLVPIMQRGSAQFYYIAVLAAQAFLSLFVFLAARALNTDNRSSRLWLLAGAGAAFGLGFHSRINTMLPAAAVAVAVLIIYFVRSIKSKELGGFFMNAAALGVPVAAALVLSLAYNYARFGSPFEFGTSYQLTILNTSLYELNLSAVIPCILFYFLHPLTVSGEFPFLHMQNIGNVGYYRTIYIDHNFGIMMLPFAWISAAVLLVWKKLSASRRIILTCAALSIFATAFVDFCLGGVIFRYIGDIAPAMALLSAFILLELYAGTENTGVRRVIKYLGVGLCAAAAVVCLAISLNYDGNFLEYSPSIYSTLKSFFVFWE